VGRFALELADIFRLHGPAWRQVQRAHLSLAQLKVMSAIEQCRSAALGGHVLRCEGCGTDQVAYNSCRNRHCPKCQSSAAKRWLDARQADLLPVAYYHVVFTLPGPIADIAYQNKAVVYGLLFDVAAETLLTIAADPKHLGASIGATLVLHTWGSALTHHPHVHGIVPGGGLSSDGQSWVACRPGFFLSVRVLSRLFRRRFLEELGNAHRADRLQFFGEHAPLADARAFADWLQVRVGGLRQAAVCRARGRAGVSVSVYAQGGHLQQPLDRDGRARRHLPLEGLPHQGAHALQGDDAGARRVHAALPVARAAWWLPSHSALRAAGQRPPQGKPRSGTRAVVA
jgi:membrane protein implicated in regulation of membrane protease activity